MNSKIVNGKNWRSTNNILCMNLMVDTPDEELLDIVKTSEKICVKENHGFCLSIGGYDSDPRELFEIPEVVSFIKKLIKLGFLTILEVSTTTNLNSHKMELAGFGALEIWMIAKNKMVKGNNNISKSLMKEFFEDLESSNSKIRSQFGNKVSDGPIKHSVPKW